MPVDVERGAAAVLASCRQFTQLLRSARTPAAGAIGSWTVAETAAHVAEIIDVETAMVEGRGAPAPDLDIAAFNAAHLQTYLDSEPAAGLSACFDVRVRGGSRHYDVIDHESLTIEAPSERRVDCHVSADPAAFLLAGYRRVGQWGPALRGQMIAWGRRPWLALRLISLLKNP